MTFLSRRDFVVASVVAAGVRPWSNRSDLDAFIEGEMASAAIPGLTAAIVKSGRLAWSRGYGWADIGSRQRMDPARTIQNIGSISKTVTGTAVMQLVEQNRIELDQDVNRYLPFPVRHPAHPSIPVTCRLLLTHRSGIIDGPAYGAGYGCADPSTALGSWLRAYLTPAGEHFRQDENFGAWQPGTTWRYSNVGFGLLGHIVEQVTGEGFRDYTREHIFSPLGIRHAGWYWADLDAARHATAYSPINPSTEKEIASARERGLIDRTPESHPTLGGFQAYCRYNFVNYPDGALRISVNELARFLIATMGTGAPILRPETVRQMLTSVASPTPESGQGLAWRATHVTSNIRWGHGGADPGIRTQMAFRPSDGIGVIVFANRGSLNLNRIVDRLFDEGVGL